MGVAHAKPSSTYSTNYSVEQITVSVDSRISEQDFQELFAVIESIPDEALQSEEAFNSWKEAQLSNSAITYASVFSCAAGITVAIVTNAFVAAKIVKLKSIITAAGGVSAAASKTMKAYKKARAAGKSISAALAEASNAVAVNGGAAARDLLLDLFSIEGVINGCFR